MKEVLNIRSVIDIVWHKVAVVVEFLYLLTMVSIETRKNILCHADDPCYVSRKANVPDV